MHVTGVRKISIEHLSQEMYLGMLIRVLLGVTEMRALLAQETVCDVWCDIIGFLGQAHDVHSQLGGSDGRRHYINDAL